MVPPELPCNETSVTADEDHDPHKLRAYDMSFSNLVKMTTCYNHCKHFFDQCPSIHFNLLISYWIMAGYLGPVTSVEDAYFKGHAILLDLIHQDILKPSDKDPEHIEFTTSTDLDFVRPCTHHGFCITQNLGFVDLLCLAQLDDVVCTHGMLKTVPKFTTTTTTTTTTIKGSVLLIDGNHLSRQVFHTPKRLKCLAYFNPRPYSLKPLLHKVKHLSILLLRGCHLLPHTDFPLDKFQNLTVLEISGSTHLTVIPDKTISKMLQLQCLNLSNLLLIETLPEDFFFNLVELRWLILRGCSKLLSLPTIKNLKKLEALDLSHCTSLSEFKSTTFQFSHLQMLDLSYTAMLSIPALKETRKLTHLFLRDVKVSVLNSLKHLNSLLVLDLSGAKNVKQIHQIKDNKKIILLNLSRTGIDSIGFLSDMTDLRYLILQGCTKLTKLPAMKNLTKLEVLDLSGCENLPCLPEDLSDLRDLKELILSGCTSLELRLGLYSQMSCLVKLELSGTKVNQLPSFAKLASLRKLSLRNLELNSIQTLTSLSNLVQLDLMSLKVSSPEEFNLDFVKSLENLQTLNLSHTLVAKLPDLSKLLSLKELLLKDCQHLKTLPDLQSLTNLETLDLSLPHCSTINKCQAGTEIEGQTGFSLSVPCCLRKLVLTNRSLARQSFPLTLFDQLEHLDLRGTNVTEIPYANMDRVKRIRLPATIDLSGVRLSRMGNLSEIIDWAGNLQESRLQGKISNPTEINFAYTLGKKLFMSGGDDQIFHLKEDVNKESWEAFIHEFPVSLPPEGSKDEVIYLDGDEFILRDELSSARRLLKLKLVGMSVEIHGFPEQPEKIQNLLQDAKNVAFVCNDFLDSLSNLRIEAIKVCCIKRCCKMKSVLGGESGQVVTRCPERLVLSDLVSLEMICCENVSSESIESLKHIHVDCCPKLEKLVIASQVPKNLETLEMKMCDKLQTVIEENISLSNLQKLNLFELPQLEGINAKLPCLKTLSISQCPKLKDLDTVMRSATSLSKLCLDYCSGLVDLFDNTISSSSSLPELHSLKTLRLWNLPKLKSIEGDLWVESTLDLDPCLPPSIRQRIRFSGQQIRNSPW